MSRAPRRPLTVAASIRLLLGGLVVTGPVVTGVLVTGVVLTALTGCGAPDPGDLFESVEAEATTEVSSVPPPADAHPVTVERVVDGDTLVVTGEPGSVLPTAGEHRVRLLLVDTPEVDGPDADEECLGPEASAFTTDLLPLGSTLMLAADQDPVDDFDRLLAYAWTPEGVFVNEALAANGFAYAVLFPPNDEHIDVVTAAEQRARQARLGVWGSC